MKMYRLKHLPSGMYFCPAREIKIKVPGTQYVKYVKSNLSKKGKVYLTKPTLSWIDSGFYSEFIFTTKEQMSTSYTYNQKLAPYIQADWIIEELNTTGDLF